MRIYSTQNLILVKLTNPQILLLIIDKKRYNRNHNSEFYHEKRRINSTIDK
jgi:hypothetical protein